MDDLQNAPRLSEYVYDIYIEQRKKGQQESTVAPSPITKAHDLPINTREGICQEIRECKQEDNHASKSWMAERNKS